MNGRLRFALKFLLFSLFLAGCGKSSALDTTVKNRIQNLSSPAEMMTAIPQTPALSRTQYCAERTQRDHFIRLGFDPKNQLSITNHGGLFGGGVCWWHSLFTRSALYLAIYRPDLPKPTREMAKKLVHSIAAGKKVVEIPGYSNLWDFSKDWSDLIQSKLEEWQLIDGFLKFAWIRGLSGSTKMDPERLKNSLLWLIYYAQNNGEINWTMFQLKGIPSHAGLILGAPTPVDSKSIDPFSLDYIDSNYPGQISRLTYKPGDRSIVNEYGPFVPYLGRRKDLERFKKAGERYCGNEALSQFSEEPELLSNDLD